MPIYEYVCRSCGQQFEWLSRSDERPVCPHCGLEDLTKQLSVPAAHVAGANVPACPAREMGACGGGACGGACGLS